MWNTRHLLCVQDFNHGSVFARVCIRESPSTSPRGRSNDDGGSITVKDCLSSRGQSMGIRHHLMTCSPRRHQAFKANDSFCDFVPQFLQPGRLDLGYAVLPRLSAADCDGISIAAGLDHTISSTSICPARHATDDGGFSSADICCVHGFSYTAVVGCTGFNSGGAGGTVFAVFIVLAIVLVIVLVIGWRAQDANCLLRACRQVCSHGRTLESR